MIPGKTIWTLIRVLMGSFNGPVEKNQHQEVPRLYQVNLHDIVLPPSSYQIVFDCCFFSQITEKNKFWGYVIDEPVPTRYWSFLFFLYPRTYPYLPVPTRKKGNIFAVRTRRRNRSNPYPFKRRSISVQKAYRKPFENRSIRRKNIAFFQWKMIHFGVDFQGPMQPWFGILLFFTKLFQVWMGQVCHLTQANSLCGTILTLGEKLTLCSFRTEQSQVLNRSVATSQFPDHLLCMLPYLLPLFAATCKLMTSDFGSG